MNRAGFLKSMFGAAVVAAMPKTVVDQIEKLPEPKPIKEKVYEHPAGDVVESIKEQINIADNEDCLYIYDEKELLGRSVDFSFNFRQEVNPIYSRSQYEKVWTGKYKKKNGKKKYKWVLKDSVPITKYWTAPKEWAVESNNIEWFVNPMDIFSQGKKLNCLMRKYGANLSGDLYMESLEVSNGIMSSSKFVGTGEVTLILEKG